MARSAEVSFVVSQVAVMPRRSMPRLETRSDRAGALFRMEQAITVPRWRPRTPGPELRLTSPASERSKEDSTTSWTRGGGCIFLLPQRKRDGTDSKDSKRACDIVSMLL